MDIWDAEKGSVKPYRYYEVGVNGVEREITREEAIQRVYIDPKAGLNVKSIEREALPIKTDKVKMNTTTPEYEQLIERFGKRDGETDRDHAMRLMCDIINSDVELKGYRQMFNDMLQSRLAQLRGE